MWEPFCCEFSEKYCHSLVPHKPVSKSEIVYRKQEAFPCHFFASISAKTKMVQKCNCPASLIIVCASKEGNLLLELLLLKHLTSLFPGVDAIMAPKASEACFINFSRVHQHIMFSCLQFH